MATICPRCGRTVFDEFTDPEHYFWCRSCDWKSTDENTLDISYKDVKTAPLSNLFPHRFEMDGVLCLSMESFIQSLRESNFMLQRKICSNYSGMMAYKMRLMLNDWRISQTIFWNNKEIKRDSSDYIALITRAYDNLFNQNILFKEFIKRNKDKYLIHSIGCHDKEETLLTEEEYRYQLTRLQKKFKNCV